MTRSRQQAVPRVEVRREEPPRGRLDRPSVPRWRGGMPDKLNLFWGLLEIRRDPDGDEHVRLFWGLLDIRTRQRPAFEGDGGSPQERAEERVEALRAVVVFGSLGIGFAWLAWVADRSFWEGIFSVASALLIALSGGHLLMLFAERFRPHFLREETERQRSRSRDERVTAGRHARDLQELTASIAHEIRNPITAAKSLVQQMGEDPNAEDNMEYATVALQELERVERSVSHLLRFARDEDVALQEVRLDEVVERALGVLAERADKEGVEIRFEADAPGEMSGDPEQLRRVVLNLLGNALDVLRDAPSARSAQAAPRIDVQMGDDLAGREVWLRVRDNGPGIPAEQQERIFRPFHTSKASGTGLGLAIMRKIVDAHGGSIEVGDAPGGGAEFLLTFPKRNGEDEAEAG